MKNVKYKILDKVRDKVEGPARWLFLTRMEQKIRPQLLRMKKSVNNGYTENQIRKELRWKT